MELQNRGRRAKRILSLFVMMAMIMTQISVSIGSLSARAADTVPVITVDTITDRADISPYIHGANHRFAYGGYGMYDTENGEVYPDFLQKTKEANLGVVRYPGGTMCNTFKWKDTIGRLDQRRNIVLGSNFNSVFPYYGLDEHMDYIDEIGAEVIYMLGEILETPEDAADLVEYLNSEVGENPNGGTDWAQVRADNGHPEPYHVTYFEIGNERSGASQHYYLDYPSLYGETDIAKRYALGDTVQATGEPVRTYGTWSRNTTSDNCKSAGTASQKFYSRYYPVTEGTQSVYVNGAKWTAVSDFTSQSGDAQVYVFDPMTGEITFGDGVHGKIPVSGALITTDYQHEHAGYVDYYESMKAVDPDIKVFSCLPEAAAYLDNNQYDGLVYHNYIGLGSNITTAEQLHDAYISNADTQVNKLSENVTDLRTRSGRNDVISAVTEFGTIGIDPVYTKSGDNIDLDEGRILSRGLAFATMLMGAANTESTIYIHQGFTANSFGGGADLSGAGQVYNSLYAPDPGDPSTTIASSMALAYQVMGQGMKGNSVINSFIENNPQIKGSKEYDALKVLTTKDENGDIYLLVVNRDSKNAINTTLNLKGYTIDGAAEISTLTGGDYTSCNTPDHPDDVYIANSTMPLGVGGSTFSYTFPAHSLVSVKLSGTAGNGTGTGQVWKESFQNRHFESTIGNTPGYLTVQPSNTNATIQLNPVPGTGNTKALKITRSGADVKITTGLAGTSSTTFKGLVKVTFQVLAAAVNNNSQLSVSVMAGDKKAADINFSAGAVKNNNILRQCYDANQWYNVEILLDYAAKRYALYIDGKYVHSGGAFPDGVTAELDCLTFELTDADNSFYLDNVYAQNADITVVSQITQIDPVKILTEVGEGPALPDQVTARYNTGEAEEKSVVWDTLDPGDIAQTGTVTVYGTVDGASIRAIAEIQVVKPVKSFEEVSVSTAEKVAPVLPKVIRVTYDDDSTETKAVKWDAIPSSQYAGAGSFTVYGTVDGCIPRAEAAVTVTEVARVPVVAVDAYTGREELTSISEVNTYLYAPDGVAATEDANEMLSDMIGKTLVDSFIEKNTVITAGTQTRNALHALAAKDHNGDLYLLIENSNADDDITAVMNLKNYAAAGDADIRILKSNQITNTTTSLLAGASTFAYTIPAGSMVFIRLSGTVATPWSENFALRHFFSQNANAVPPWLSVEQVGSGVASVQIDPSPVYRPGVTENSKAFLMTRSGTDIRVKATLSGQNFSAPPHTSYTGLLKITFDMKILQDDSASSNNITINSGDTAVLDLAFEGGKVSCNGAQKSSYEKDKWYAVEIVLDHQAGEYAVYLDGACICSRNKYTVAIDDPDSEPLDYMFFHINNADGSFYFDNYQVSRSDFSITSQITQVEDTYVTTQSGTAPSLPGTVCAVYNTSEKTERTVVWETIDPSEYASQGTFTVSGTVDGLSMSAKAFVAVLSEIREIAPVAVTTTAGTAPIMPGTVTVTYEDGSTGSKAVTWEEIDPSEYASAGSFTVNGTVDGTDMGAVATVTVNAEDITITAVREVEVTTDAGIGPVLPDKVIVEYSDGTTGEKSVVWEEIDPSEYASAGSFTVNGTVDGTDMGAVAVVTVNAPVLKGDMNGDGKLDASDVLKLRRTIAAGNATAEQIKTGDLNGDHELTSADVALLMEELNLLLGDVNGDGKIGALDIMQIRKRMLDGNVTDAELAAGDLDENGTLGALDIMKLRKLLLDLA